MSTRRYFVKATSLVNLAGGSFDLPEPEVVGDDEFYFRMTSSVGNCHVGFRKSWICLRG